MPPYGCNTDEHSSKNLENAIAKKALLSLSDSSTFYLPYQIAPFSRSHASSSAAGL